MSEAEEKTIKAGEILKKVLKEAEEKVFVGAKILDVAEFIEGRIVELGAKPAFPVNVSINSDAAHFTPAKGDERVFKKGDLVKIDAGAHIDGFIADMAISIDLGENTELIKASKEALMNAIDAVKAGIDTAKLGKIIEETIKKHGFKPVVNLTGHGLLPYIAHAPPSIYNYATQRGVVLEEGDIIAIEPFATNGAGLVTDSSEAYIFRYLSPKKAKKFERELLATIWNRFRSLPFCDRWVRDIIPGETLPKLIELSHIGSLYGYHVLVERGRGLVAQSEHTVIVCEDGVEVITSF
ncbi:MAG: type II methionyl aminopeptidase [Nitrososphaerota archaeon]